MLVPTQADDFVADLIGPSHVVVPNCPQVPRFRHCRSSTSIRFLNPAAATRETLNFFGGVLFLQHAHYPCRRRLTRIWARERVSAALTAATCSSESFSRRR